VKLTQGECQITEEGAEQRFISVLTDALEAAKAGKLLQGVLITEIEGDSVNGIRACSQYGTDPVRNVYLVVCTLKHVMRVIEARHLEEAVNQMMMADMVTSALEKAGMQAGEADKAAQEPKS